MTAPAGSLVLPFRKEGRKRDRVGPEPFEDGEVAPVRGIHDEVDAVGERDSLRTLCTDEGEVLRRAGEGIGAGRGLTNFWAGSIVRTAAGPAVKMILADTLRLRPPSEPSSMGTSRIFTG